MLQVLMEVVLMSKVKVQIWGREFELGVSYQNYPGEEKR